MKIEAVRTDRFRIPLPEALSDSTHGVMSHFELVAVRLTDSDRAEGVGYTYTVDCGGGAVAALIRDDLADWLPGRDPRRVERLWHDMGWRLHFVGRGGIAAFAMAAADVALWDLKARRAGGYPILLPWPETCLPAMAAPRGVGNVGSPEGPGQPTTRRGG